MKNKLLFTFLILCFPIICNAATKTFCNQFSPAQNKKFTDTFLLNEAVITRSGNDKITGTFTNKSRKAGITGLCNGTQLSFWWRTPNFEGQFSGTLVCLNGVFNIINIFMSIAGEEAQPIVAMASVPTGQPCPKVDG